MNTNGINEAWTQMIRAKKAPELVERTKKDFPEMANIPHEILMAMAIMILEREIEIT